MSDQKSCSTHSEHIQACTHASHKGEWQEHSPPRWSPVMPQSASSLRTSKRAKKWTIRRSANLLSCRHRSTDISRGPESTARSGLSQAKAISQCQRRGLERRSRNRAPCISSNASEVRPQSYHNTVQSFVIRNSKQYPNIQQ